MAAAAAACTKVCVVCNTKLPEDGRLLRCSHILCLSCLNDTVTTEGKVQCQACKAVTVPWFTAAKLSDQLPASKPLLYRDAITQSGSGGCEDIVYCDYCEDDDEPSVASHRCLNCDGAGLCEKHASSHVKKKTFRTHQVVSVGDGSVDGAKPLSVNSVCPVHSKYPITRYCSSCQHTLCEKCLLAGHDAHDIQDLSTVAHDKRQSIKSMLNSSLFGTTASSEAASTSNCGTNLFQSVMAKMDKHVERLQDESTAASEAIETTFATVKEMMKTKDKLLEKVDGVRWTHQEPMELRRQRLNALSDQHNILIELAQALSQEDMSQDADAVSLADDVVDKLAEFNDEVGKEMMPSKAFVIQALVDRSALQRLEKNFTDLMDIASKKLDLSGYRLNAPADVPLNYDVVANISPLALIRTSLPEKDCRFLTATLSSPSGNNGTTSPSNHPDQRFRRKAPEFRLTPTEKGQHQLAISWAGETMLSAKIEVSDRQTSDQAAASNPPVGLLTTSVTCETSGTAFTTDNGRLLISGKMSEDVADSTTRVVTGLANETVVGCALGLTHGLAVTDTGRLYSFGVNDKGQCGRQQRTGQVHPCQDGHQWRTKKCMICKVCSHCTGFGARCCRHNDANRRPGAECGCGQGLSGCSVCGCCRSCENHAKKTDTPSALPPGAVKLPGDSWINVVHAAAGDNHSLALTSTGDVYAFGSNSHGQLDEAAEDDVLLPVKVDLPGIARKVFAAGNSTVVLLANGQVIKFG